jgi:hypothetical protein
MIWPVTAVSRPAYRASASSMIWASGPAGAGQGGCGGKSSPFRPHLYADLGLLAIKPWSG